MEHRSATMMLYTVSSCAIIFQLFSPTMFLGLVLLIIAFFMARTLRRMAKGTIYESHAEWARRTLSIGTFVLMPLSLCAAIWFIWTYSDFSTIQQAMNPDSGGDLAGAVTTYANNMMPKAERITALSLALPMLWWLRRNIFGYLRARDGVPVDYPGSLL